MSIPSSGQLTFSDLQNEYGGANPIGLGEYYAGGSYVAAGTGGDSGAIPSSGALRLGGFYGSAAAGIIWGSRFLRPGGNNSEYKIKYVNNRFFILGQIGNFINAVITYSTDSTGTNWSTVGIPRIAGSTLSPLIYDIEWTGSLYVAVGISLYSSTNCVITSPDLINWTPRNVVGGSRISSIAWSGSILVATTSTAGQLVTSPDGITWTTRSTAATSSFNQVIWNGFVFVAVGGTNSTYYSTDGITWQAGNGYSTDTLNRVAWGNNTFVATTSAGSYVYTSPNGITWTKRTHTLIGQGGSIAYGAGLFVQVSVGTSEVVTSPDGITWTYRSFIGTQTSGFAGTGLSDPQLIKTVGFGSGIFIAAGNGLVVSSADGLNWTSLSTGAVPKNNLRAVATNGSTIVAVGDSGRNTFNRLSNKPTLMTSSDGNTWNHINTNALTTSTYYNLFDVIWTGTRFVAVGGNQSTTSAGVLIWTSEDGASWTSRLDNNANYRLTSVAKQGNRLIAISDSNTQEWVSDDGGLTWTVRTNSYGYGIASSSSVFVKITNAGSVSGIYATPSFDGGATWSTATIIPSTDYRDVTRVKWVNNRFIICGQTRSTSSGFMLYSLDGVSWSSCVIPDSGQITGISFFYDVSYSFGKYYAVSNKGIFVSTDGVNFSLLSGYSYTAGSGFGALYGITNTSNKIITVGGAGIVVTSPPPSSAIL